LTAARGQRDRRTTTHGFSRGIAGILAAALFVAAFDGCRSAPPTNKGYAQALAADRVAKDEHFRTASDSPVPPNRRSELLPLAYFPIDPDYNVPATLKPATDQTPFEMVTSTGGKSQMRPAGILEFSLKGHPLKLTALAEEDGRLFVPFTDLTTGTETYPGGRYVDLERNASGIYFLDFNRAYQPYCYYNTSYECPYPPPENRLQVPVRAGERLKQPNT